MKREFSVYTILDNPFDNKSILNMKREYQEYKKKLENSVFFGKISFIVSSLLLCVMFYAFFKESNVILGMTSTFKIVFYTLSFIGLSFVGIACGLIVVLLLTPKPPLVIKFGHNEIPIKFSSFLLCTDVDIEKVNSISRIRNFYDEITKKQERPLYNFEYDMICLITDKVLEI